MGRGWARGPVDNQNIVNSKFIVEILCDRQGSTPECAAIANPDRAKLHGTIKSIDDVVVRILTALQVLNKTLARDAARSFCRLVNNGGFEMICATHSGCFLFIWEMNQMSLSVWDY